MLVDLDWPLNASSLLSASAELLVSFWFATTVSSLVGNAAEISGLSAITYSLTFQAVLTVSQRFRDIQYSGARTSLTGSRHGNLNFHRVIYFRLDLYIRDRGGTTASPCVWPEDHGRSRFYATYVVRTRHYGCWSVSQAARWEADSRGRLLRPTLLDDVVSMIFYRKFATYLTRNRRK